MSAHNARDQSAGAAAPVIESISAVTLATSDMARATSFYRTLGFKLLYGGAKASFTSFEVGTGYLNLILVTKSTTARGPRWGRIIFYVSNVDALYEHAIALGLRPESPPRDAEWGERYFHLSDVDGHELSLAKPLK